MAREATVDVRFVGGVWTTRIRIRGKRVPFDLPTCGDEAKTKERSKLLVAAREALRFRERPREGPRRRLASRRGNVCALAQGGALPKGFMPKDWTLDGSRLGKLCAIDVGGQLLGDIRIDRVTLDHA